MAEILLVGESWIRHSTDIKGFDSFSSSSYGVGTEWIEQAVTGAGHAFHHLPCHLVDTQWPDLSRYDAVLLSDVGANTFMLTSTCWDQATVTRNPLAEIVEYVGGGGGFGMIGGYLSFSGLQAQAAYANTPIADILPVQISPYDDRVEHPEGVEPVAVTADHPALGGARRFGPLLGYNRLTLRPEGTLLATVDGDPLLTVGTHGSGRVFAYAADCHEHWGTRAYLGSEDYLRLWGGLVSWCAGSERA